MKKTLVLVATVLVLCRAGWALINPNFTPKHLSENSDTVVVGTLEDTQKNQEWRLTVTEKIKGEAGKTEVFSLANCHKDHVGDIEQALKRNAKDPVIFFVGTYQDQKGAFMQAGGMWLEIKENGENRWDVAGYAQKMGETFAGGTDKLISMSRYLVKDRGSDVPCSAGIRWGEHMKLGKITGTSAGMAGVEMGKNRKVHLFVASTDGDKLFRPETKDLETKWTDVTGECGVDTKSHEFLWADVNGDGTADLVTWDGSAVSVRFAGEDGKLKAGAAGWTAKVEAGCMGLAACSPDGTPGVLVSTRSTPVLLKTDKDGWKPVELPAGADELGAGQPSACVVADLDLDGCPDILQPGEQSGILWKGKAGGFEKPVKTDVSTGGGPAKIAVGDFDESGSLDIFLSGAQRNTLWENDGKAGFKEVFRFSGSMSYKCPANASDVKALDLNHDGRTDLCFVYAGSDILYHFNRGFRSFGEEGEVRLTGLETKPDEEHVGQTAMAIADFDKSGSADLAILLTTGDVYVYLNDQFDMPALNLRLPKGSVAPVTVSCWEGDDYKVCFGTASVTGQTPAKYVVARYPGKVTLKWTVPGKGAVTREVKVEDKTLDVTIEPGVEKAK